MICQEMNVVHTKKKEYKIILIVAGMKRAPNLKKGDIRASIG